MKKCKHCKTEIDKKAKICPNCNKKQGGLLKPILIGLLILAVIGALTDGNKEKENLSVDKSTSAKTEVLDKKETDPTVAPDKDATEEVAEETVKEVIEEVVAEPEVKADEPVEAVSESDSMTLGQKNALDKAESYLNYSSFSHRGLITQLEFEGFSNEDATYATDNCGADWNEQAAAKAKSYLDYSSFSKSGLIEQLEFEGFTMEQAEHGATEVGY